jgi:rubrerythrin
MFTNEDLLHFFDCMMEPEKHKRDFFNNLSDEVDDPSVKGVLENIAMDEQRQIQLIQRIMDLVNGAQYRRKKKKKNIKKIQDDRRLENQGDT